MADINLRSDSIDVDDIMRQIRARIRDKRGADYTEDEVRHLASVKLERLLDPKSVRSNLPEHYRQRAAEPTDETYEFEADSIYDSHRAPLRWIRRLLSPIVKLFFNANRISHALHLQSKINKRRRELEALTFEVLNNLVVELTRANLEIKHLRLRLESMSARLDFDERRARSLESVVQYRPEALAGPPREHEEDEPATEGESAQAEAARKRRRRRRGRRRPGVEDGPAGGARAEGAEPQPGNGGAGSGEQ